MQNSAFSDCFAQHQLFDIATVTIGNLVTNMNHRLHIWACLLLIFISVQVAQALGLPEFLRVIKQLLKIIEFLKVKKENCFAH